METITQSAEPLVARLREEFANRVVTPEHDDYEQARLVFSARVDRRPVAIVRPGDTAQVSRLVTLVREAGLELAVRGGGHSGAGHGVCDGVVLDLSGMKGIEIDAEGRTAWAQTGLTAGEYTAAVGEHGLATGFGDTGVVGIGGITLGGGIGYLSRKYGLTIDDVLAAEVVTADGQILHVDAENHPDLFWAIRGGGGNFGVVTRIKYRLHELDGVVGGLLVLPASADVLHQAVAIAEAAPDELSTIINVMVAPPMPFLPAEVHGQLIIMVMLCYAGPAEDGEQIVAPFRELATPIVDMVRPMSYPEMFPPEHPPRMGAVSRMVYLDGLSAESAELITDRLTWSPAPMRAVQLRVLGGAIARTADDATAYAHRGRRLMGNVAAMSPDPAAVAEYEPWVDKVAGKLKEAVPGTYVNFLGDEGPERVREAYPGKTGDRLAEVKRVYDPANFFRLNQNVLPAGVGDGV
ncbi:FAD-binding oxidoreductase [Phytoactinopolyspora halotolerans]|uniref:FAD-binding oxidoreductase n=1 Tax=Phytoactinopolyspora halotolerans TaxID=1981512 RepID=A0A6L9S5I2_9ACTN|nr:FAD-binding oxidoreductase [Phytoactinopolyspora halotolerans]NEE00001.1 FAD-binding oxidoreductase [Phytoactinopolyspora halotolerans]